MNRRRARSVDHLHGFGEYMDGGGVGGAFSLFTRGSMIEGRTSKAEEDALVCSPTIAYLEIGHDRNGKG